MSPQYLGNHFGVIGSVFSPRDLKITAFEVIPHENPLSPTGVNQEEIVDRTLAKLRARHVLGFPIGTVLNSKVSLNMNMNIKASAVDRAEGILQLKIANNIPFKIEDTQWRGLLPDQKELSVDEATDVYTIATKNKSVQAAIQPSERNGLSVDLLQPSSTSLVNYLYATLGMKETVCIEVNESTTNLVILKNDAFWTCNLRYGGDIFTKALSERMELSTEEAERLKQNSSVHETPRATAVLRTLEPAFENFTGEISQILKHYQETKKENLPREIIALAGGSRLTGLKTCLSKLTNGRTSVKAVKLARV